MNPMASPIIDHRQNFPPPNPVIDGIIDCVRVLFVIGLSIPFVMVYPRVGGGNSSANLRTAVVSGLSPRGRGKRFTHSD